MIIDLLWNNTCHLLMISWWHLIYSVPRVCKWFGQTVGIPFAIVILNSLQLLEWLHLVLLLFWVAYKRVWRCVSKNLRRTYHDTLYQASHYTEPGLTKNMCYQIVKLPLSFIVLRVISCYNLANNSVLSIAVSLRLDVSHTFATAHPAVSYILLQHWDLLLSSYHFIDRMSLHSYFRN